MHCPFCNEDDTKVIDSRLVAEGFQVRRRRQCVGCNERFTTFEVAELIMPNVIKSNKVRDPFNEDKLRSGMQRALEKRPVSSDEIEDAISRIKSKLRATGEREVPAKLIGDFVIEELKRLDKIAYIRFASVYFSFDDIEQFTKEIANLEQRKANIVAMIDHSSHFTDSDLSYMQQAIALAKRGRFTTTPNPNVGCIIVKDGKIIGEGYHHKAGEPHAEVHALREAGLQAKGATAYVTLEPCSHFGRTPPCADALIQAGILRVVVAMQDPNPNVSGNGIARLREAGVTVNVGLCADEAEYINRAFLKHMRTGLPYVQLKLAASLDGKIAMASGESKWITSTLARKDVQQFRAQTAAILSTRATVQTDNASLTVRYAELPETVQEVYPQNSLRQPVRVILDSQNLLTGAENIFQQPGKTWVVRKSDIAIKQPNCHVLIEASNAPHIDLLTLLKQLGEKQINSVWVEGGAQLAGALIEQDLVDELIIYYAPKLLGHNAKNLAVLPNLIQLADAPQFEFKSLDMIGDDLRCVLYKKST